MGDNFIKKARICKQMEIFIFVFWFGFPTRRKSPKLKEGGKLVLLHWKTKKNVVSTLYFSCLSHLKQFVTSKKMKTPWKAPPLVIYHLHPTQLLNYQRGRRRSYRETLKQNFPPFSNTPNGKEWNLVPSHFFFSFLFWLIFASMQRAFPTPIVPCWRIFN